MASVLAAGLSGGTTGRVPIPCEHADEVLRPRIGLGLQRVGDPAGAARARLCERPGIDDARLRARVFAGVREREQKDQCRRIPERATDARRLPDHPEREQTTDHGADASGVVRPRVPRRLARSLWTEQDGRERVTERRGTEGVPTTNTQWKRLLVAGLVVVDLTSQGLCP